MARSSPSRSRHRHHPLQQQQPHHRHRYRSHSSRDRSGPYPYPSPDPNHKARKASEPSSISHADASFGHRHRYHRQVHDSRHRLPHRRETNPSRNPSSSSSSSSSCKSAEEMPSTGVMNRSPKRHESWAPRFGSALRPSSDPPSVATAAAMTEAKVGEEESRQRSDAPPKPPKVEVLAMEQELRGSECSNRPNRKRAVWELACALAHAYVSQLDSSRRSEKEAEDHGDIKNAEGLTKRLAVRQEPDASPSASSSSSSLSKRMDTIVAQPSPPMQRTGTTVVPETEPSPPPQAPRSESQNLKEPPLAQARTLPGAVHEEEASNGQNTQLLHRKGEQRPERTPDSSIDAAQPWRRNYSLASGARVGLEQATTKRKRQHQVIDLNAMPTDEHDEEDEGRGEDKELLVDLNTTPVKSGFDLNAEPGEWGGNGCCAMEVEEEKTGIKKQQQQPSPSLQTQQMGVTEWLGKHFPSAAAAMVS